MDEPLMAWWPGARNHARIVGRALSLSSVLFLAFVVSAIMARAEAPFQGRDRSESGHLVPVDPYRSGSSRLYIERCHKLLGVEEFEAAELLEPRKQGTVVMVRRPASQPEECIALREKAGATEYELTYARADRSVLAAMQQDPRKEPAGRVEVAKLTRPLDRERALRVYKIWERMLSRVRYPAGGACAGCPDDGEKLEFRYSWKGMYGETASPLRGASKRFADLGNILILYCRSQGHRANAALLLLDKECDGLEKVLDTEEQAEAAREASSEIREKR